MPELPAVRGSDAVAAFERAGFALVRISGSHHILKKPGHTYALSVPCKKGKTLKRGLLLGLIKDAGLTAEQFIALLG